MTAPFFTPRMIPKIGLANIAITMTSMTQCQIENNSIISHLWPPVQQRLIFCGPLNAGTFTVAGIAAFPVRTETLRGPTQAQIRKCYINEKQTANDRHRQKYGGNVSARQQIQIHGVFQTLGLFHFGFEYRPLWIAPCGDDRLLSSPRTPIGFIGRVHIQTLVSLIRYSPLQTR